MVCYEVAHELEMSLIENCRLKGFENGEIEKVVLALNRLLLLIFLFVVYFAKVGVVKQLALAMSLLSFSFFILYGAIGGLIYVLTVHRRRLQPGKSSAV